jgi:hypothetical protein
MIIDYPILNYLSTKTGKYINSDGTYEIELRRNHYSYAILSNTNMRGSNIYGVIGVLGENLEFHASVGLPNIIVFTWPHAFKKIQDTEQIKLVDRDLGSDMELCISFCEGNFNLTFIVNGKVNKSYALSKA